MRLRWVVSRVFARFMFMPWTCTHCGYCAWVLWVDRSLNLQTCWMLRNGWCGVGGCYSSLNVHTRWKYVCNGCGGVGQMLQRSLSFSQSTLEAILELNCRHDHCGCYAMDGVGGYVNVHWTCKHGRCYALDGVGWGDVNVPWCCHIVDATQWMVWLGAKCNWTCTHGRWDGVGWMPAVLELAHVHKVLAMEMG